MIKRTMYFDVIQDTRFSPDTARENVIEWVNKIHNQLSKLPVVIQIDSIRELKFSGNEPCMSYRQRIYVKKAGKVTWDTIYKAVNSIKPCVYNFLLCTRAKSA